jgi:hypothetical protein
MRTAHARHVDHVELVLGERVEELDPNAVAPCEAPKLWEQYAHVARFAESAMILLARRVDEAAAWKRNGFKSAAEQMAADVGTSVGATQGVLDTSKRVAQPTLPGVVAGPGRAWGPRILDPTRTHH